jgi:CBS domain-containing protein
MQKDPVFIEADCTLREAAQRMDELNCGVLPVGTKDHLEGIITDRDIVLRAVAKGKNTNEVLVKDFMTAEVCNIEEDDTTDRAAGIMRAKNINRLLVHDEQGKPSGILTFGHIIRDHDSMQEITSAIECAVGRKVA